MFKIWKQLKKAMLMNMTEQSTNQIYALGKLATFAC